MLWVQSMGAQHKHPAGSPADWGQEHGGPSNEDSPKPPGGRDPSRAGTLGRPQRQANWVPDTHHLGNQSPWPCRAGGAQQVPAFMLPPLHPATSLPAAALSPLRYGRRPPKSSFCPSPTSKQSCSEVVGVRMSGTQTRGQNLPVTTPPGDWQLDDALHRPVRPLWGHPGGAHHPRLSPGPAPTPGLGVATTPCTLDPWAQP